MGTKKLVRLGLISLGIIVVVFTICFELRDTGSKITNQVYASHIDFQEDKTSNQVDKDDPIVYVTRTGQCYHSSYCSYLRRSKIPMKLSEARRYYRPCSKCNPPR